jgi:cytochrome P450
MLLTTYRVATDPLAAMTALRERYGDPFLAPMANGPVIITAEPELIKELFANRDPDLFNVFASEALNAFLGDHSLLLLAGEPHRRERKLLTPPFHGERMRAYADVMADATRQSFARLREGQEFLALEQGTHLSLEVIVRAVFGVDQHELIRTHAHALRSMLEAAKPVFMFSKATQVAPFGLGPWAKFKRISAEVDRLLLEQMDRVRGRTQGREDILSLMLDTRDEDGQPMTDAHIRDELRTLLVAGHETTAITLAWTLYAIHRHPEVRTRLLAQLDALGPDPEPEAIAKLPYLNAVIDETLRLYPVVEVVFRGLRKPWKFAGYELPAGMTLSPAISIVHQRPDLYPEPRRFKPERFLDAKPKPYEYLPFGGGHRRCIGAAFSHFESRIAIGILLREYEFELLEPGEPVIRRRSLTLGPKSGIRMRMLRRRRVAV